MRTVPHPCSGIPAGRELERVTKVFRTFNKGCRSYLKITNQYTEQEVTPAWGSDESPQPAAKVWTS